MTVKLTDVAKLAGCSVTTVSRVINNYGYISDKTRQKVHEAMRELNYQPNSLARSLHGKQTKLVGLIFPGVSNPFFGELVEKIEDALFEQGYKAILCNAGTDKEKERAYLRMLLANQVDGVIAGAHNLGIEEYRQANLPIISFDRQLSEQVPIISSDNFQGGIMATEELYQAGCRRIHFLGSTEEDSHPTNKRLEGYLHFMKEHGLPEKVHSATFGESLSVKKMVIKEILAQRQADGIFCTDDLTAILVLNIAKELGIRVPQDLKVVGFDGTKFIRDYHPELTTIIQPIDDIAAVLIKLLRERIEQPNKKLKHTPYILPVSILRRNSTAAG